MNKRILAAAGAVASFVATAAFAEEDLRAAQVYDIKVTVKTTQATRGSLSAKKNPFLDGESGSIVYRKQASQTWTGVLWGCGCETIEGSWRTLDDNPAVVAGVVIWNSKKPNDIILLDDLRWHVLNAIDQKGDKCECAWTIGESDDDSAAFLAFSGFGTLSLATEKDEEGALMLRECESVLSSVSGNVAGWVPSPELVTAGKEAVCTFCGVKEAGEESTSERAVAWSYCPCTDFGGGEDSFAAVSGTWSFKYSSTLSKKLMKTSSILDAYTKFPSNVRTAVAEKIFETKAE